MNMTFAFSFAPSYFTMRYVNTKSQYY